MTVTAPRSAEADRNRAFVLLAVATVPCIAVSIGALILVPQYEDMFASFGTERPTATLLLLATYRWWSLAPVAVFALWSVWPNPVRRGEAAVVFGSLLAAGLAAFGVFACYAPIFTLARSI